MAHAHICVKRFAWHLASYGRCKQSIVSLHQAVMMVDIIPAVSCPYPIQCAAAAATIRTGIAVSPPHYHIDCSGESLLMAVLAPSPHCTTLTLCGCAELLPTPLVRHSPFVGPVSCTSSPGLCSAILASPKCSSGCGFFRHARQVEGSTCFDVCVLRDGA